MATELFMTHHQHPHISHPLLFLLENICVLHVVSLTTENMRTIIFHPLFILLHITSLYRAISLMIMMINSINIKKECWWRTISLVHTVFSFDNHNHVRNTSTRLDVWNDKWQMTKFRCHKCEYFTPDCLSYFLMLYASGEYVGVVRVFSGASNGNLGPNLGPFKNTLEGLNPTFHNTYKIIYDNSDGDAIFLSHE